MRSFVVLLAVVLAPCVFGGSVAMANERIVSHPSTQLALFGYDPVSYFADEDARLGSAEHELLYKRLVWRFANDGNRDAFLADPQRFLPAYGGHGALMAARGAAADGHPEVWLVLGGRVFLFRDAAARFAFLLEAERNVQRADTHWPELRETLSP